ncbi:MAG: glycine zipper 2TM domain-containing protein [Sulfitobacter sp.]
MKKFLLAVPMIAALAACEPGNPNQGALTGAALGAATGAAVSGGDDKVQGAIVGGLVGAAAGNYIGRTQSGSCVYERPNGTRYTAACP